MSSGRPRLYPDNATRQRAYRQRQTATLAVLRRKLARKVLTFPISEFGLCSCGFLVHPL